MELRTKYFGTISCREEDLLHFPAGFIGFEDETEFFLLPFEGSDGTLLCFQSAKTPALAFVAMDPFALDAAYTPELTDSELKQMGVSCSQELSFYTLCVVKEPVNASTLNLRCPVAINHNTQTAMQVILESNAYHMRHALSEFGPKGEDGSC